jgi:hypothetical protein
MLMPHYQKALLEHSIKVANRSLEDAAKIKYLGTTLTYQNLHARRDS